MGLATRQSLETVEQCLVNSLGTKLIDQFVVVDGLLLSVAGYGALDIPGSDYLSMSMTWICRLNIRCIRFKRRLDTLHSGSAKP